MRYKRPRGSPARDRLHHGCFYLYKIPLIKKFPYELDYPRPFYKDIPDLWIYYEVKITLPVTYFHIRKAMPFFREGHQGLGKEPYKLSLYGEFICLGAKNLSFNTYNIPDIKTPEIPICIFTD